MTARPTPAEVIKGACGYDPPLSRGACAFNVLAALHAAGYRIVHPDDEAADATPTDLRCRYEFPLPWWAGADQMDRCRCDLPNGHDGGHSCSHLRAEATP